jgi:signal peptidase I
MLHVGIGGLIGYNIDVLSVVEGTSMYPTLEPNQRLLHIPRWLRELYAPIRPGDVVLVDVDAKVTVCKRVVGMGGFAEKLSWERAHFAEDDDIDFDAPKRHQSEAWAPCQHRYINSATWLWLEGDNSNNSFDSREAGAVPIECVKGPILGVVWPIEDWKRIS